MNLSWTYNLANYKYFECVDTLKADKAIRAALESYKVKNSWFNCDLQLIVDTIRKEIAEVTASFEPRKKHKGGFHGDITFITESGYLMLVKSFTDELSWNVQRMLVNSYFNYKEEKPYEYFDKTYNGEPVLTLTDIEYLTGIDTATANCHLKKHGIMFSEYYLLSDGELVNFKKENPKTNNQIFLFIFISYK